MRNIKPSLFGFLAFTLFLVLSAASPAAPPADGGPFPTNTPTPTATFTAVPFPSNTPVFLPTVSGAYPFITNTPAGLAGQPPSNIQENPEVSRSNPLIAVAFIALFILLVVGVWMLFSRRGMNP